MSDLTVTVKVDAKQVIETAKALLEQMTRPDLDVTKTVGYLNGKTEEEMKLYFQGYADCARYLIGHFETRV